MKETWLKTDLMGFPEEKEANPETFLQNNRQNKIGVRLYKGNVPYIPESGSTVDALVLLPDDTTIENDQNASIHENIAEMTLESACYNQTGPIQIAIRLKENGQVTTIGIIRGIVYPS